MYSYVIESIAPGMARKENVNVRMDPDIVAQLDEEAEERGLSRSEYVRWMIRNRDVLDVEATLDEHETRISALEYAVDDLRSSENEE